MITGFIKIGNNGFVVSQELYDKFGAASFWTAEKANLAASQQKEFGKQIERLLIDREKLQLKINAEKNAASVLETMLHSNNAIEAAKSNWQAIVPKLYKTVDAAQLFSPVKNLDMLINAAKSASANGGYNPNLIVSCIEDASHYEDGIRGLFMISAYRDGRLEGENGKKIWDSASDKRMPAILRYNGFGASQFPTDEIGILSSDGSSITPIDRVIFESSFDGVNAAKHFHKAIAENKDPYEFGGPVAYYPKTENPADIALLDKILRAMDKATDLPLNASKMALVLEDTKQMVLLDEALYEGRGRIIMVSFGRYDAVDANICMHQLNKDQVPPGPDSMSITTAPALYQEGRMIQLLARHGVTIVGGMADMVRDSNPIIENEAQKKVVADKKREAMQGASASWCSSPFQVPYVQQGLKEGREANERLAADGNQTNFDKCCTATYSVEQIVNFPKGIITEEEIDRFVIRKGLEFFEGYIRGIGCVPIKLTKPEWATMDDFATGGRFQGMFAWITAKHGADMLCLDGVTIKTITPALYQRKIDEAVQEIKKNYAAGIMAKGAKASAVNFSESKYQQAAEMFMECITSQTCPSTVKDEHSWPAYLSAHGRIDEAKKHLNRLNSIRIHALQEFEQQK